MNLEVDSPEMETCLLLNSFQQMRNFTFQIKLRKFVVIKLFSVLVDLIVLITDTDP